MDVEFDKLILDQIVFELRFKDGFYYWDNCGKIWGEIAKIYPDPIRMEGASTQSASIVIEDRDFLRLGFGPDKINYFQTEPIFDMGLISKFAQSTFEIICNHLMVNTFTRIGNRFVFVLPVKDDNAIDEYFSQLQIIREDKIAANKFLKNPDGGQYKKRRFLFLFENNSHGYQISISSGNKKLKVRYPACFNEEQKIYSKESKILIFDIDCFTNTITDIKSLNPKEYIETEYTNLKENLFKLIR